jgi:hypothetical protein
VSNFRNKKTRKIIHDSKSRYNNSMTLRGKMSYVQIREKDRKRNININNSKNGNNRTYNNVVDKSKSKSKNKNNNSIKKINKKK